MPQLQNHRAQATMRLQFQQQQPPVTRLLHPRLHRTATACLLKIMIKFKIKFEIIFVKLKLKSFRIQETQRPQLQVIRQGVVIFEGSDSARIEAIIQPGDTLSNGRSSIVYQGPAPDVATDLHHGFAARIQRAFRIFLSRKHDAIEIEEDLRCPLSLSLFSQPVCASDGVTYEMSWVQRFINQQRRWPCRGPSGIEMPGPNLVINRAVFNATDQFRTQHRMAPMRQFQVPQPAAPQQVPQPAAPQQIPQPVAPAPQRAQHQFYQPTMSVQQATRHILSTGVIPDELLKMDTFLNEIRKPGLNHLMQLTEPGRYHSDWTKPRLIQAVLANLQTRNVNANQLFDNEDFLKHCTNDGLNMILAVLRRQFNGNHAGKIHVIKQHIPITVTVKDVYGEFQTVVTRRESVQQFYADVQNHRHNLVVDGVTTFNRSENMMACTLGQLNVNAHSVLELTDRFPIPAPAPQDSSCQYVDISTIERIGIERIESYRTIELLKRNRNNVDCRRARLHQQHHLQV